MKGGKAFPADFYAEIARYNFKAMAEIIIWHEAKKGVGAGKVAMQPDDPRLGPMVETARQKGWPFVAHIEFGSLGFSKSGYLKKFEAFLSVNNDIPMGLIHMGQLKAEDAARLLSAHPNLFFITSHCNPVTASASILPWTVMFDGHRLAPAWKKLVLAFPDRFVLAFDNVYYFHWNDKFMPQVLIWRQALNDLPDDVAHALAHGNAERLWHLAPASLP